jgi:dTDP-4-amino-4,6-dideoxygalactose transaminase
MPGADDLAILGGNPRFDQVVHVGRPNVGDRQRYFVLAGEMFDRCWLTNNGPFVEELESRITERLGVRHCVAVCNGTLALEIAVRATGMSGEVIVPSFTFVGTAHALQWQGVTPVFCDVDPRTHNLDPAKVEELITSRTTGIMGVHLWGRPCDVSTLSEIADRHGLSLVFDAAHAFASQRDGVMVGGFGSAEVFSFHATKFFNTFEGGAITTNDEHLADRLRLMRNFGFADIDDVVELGTNGKMPETCAAMGLVNLDSVDEFIEVNRSNYQAYRRGLDGLPGITLLDPDLMGGSNHQYIVVEVEAEATGLSRDDLVRVLWAENIHARRYFTPGCHRMEPYLSLFPASGRRLPVTERLADAVMVLPTGTSVDPSAIGVICDVIRAAVSLSNIVAKHVG